MFFKSVKLFKRLLIFSVVIFAFLAISFWKEIAEKEPEKVTEDPWIKKHWNHIKILSSINYVQTVKIILLWTKFFGTVDYVPKFSTLGCSTSNCFVTYDRDYLNKSAALLFHLRDINLEDMPYFRTENQVWILLHHESPHHTPDILKYLDGHFNWTATYRYDSEIILSPLVKKVKTSVLDNINHAKGKKKMVAWLVSNCKTPSKREEFVIELKKTIPVDIYGSCGNFSCLPKMSDECYKKLSKIYRFYLSFENSICKDYVTEKFFHILNTNMVPVVLGGSNYSKVAPPLSYINALSFKAPRDLGLFLLQVAKDEKRYNSYFEWRKSYQMQYDRHYVCSICERLNNPNIKRSTYFNISDWWFQDGNCKSWSPTLNFS